MTERLPSTLLRRAVAAALCWAAAGCSGGASRDALEATTVLTYDRCRGLEPGLTRVDYPAVAGIRGSTLLTAGDSTHAGEPVPGNAAEKGGLLLVAISRGEQPTPGYGLTLDGARRREHTAVVLVEWRVPEPGAILPQAVTHPCLVVALPAAAGLERVEARTEAGGVLGTLELAGGR